MASGLSSKLALPIAASVIGVALVVAVFASRLLRISANPENELISLIKQTERDGLSLPIEGTPTPLVSEQIHFDRITVNVDFQNQSAEAFATLDFNGKLGAVQVSSLGVERIRFRYRDGDWHPTAGYAAMLSGIVSTLERRRTALSSGDEVALWTLWGADAGTARPVDPDLRAVLAVQQRRYLVAAWYIRSEREDVLVSEDYLLTGQLPDRPADARGTRRLTLKKRGSEFFFWPRLM